MSRSHGKTVFVFDMTDYQQNLPGQGSFALDSHQQQITITRNLSWPVREEYLEDIMRHREYMENKTLPITYLIDKQREIQWFMRPMLIDFLIEAHASLKLLPETLSLAINLLDRYCSKRQVKKEHYQLVGCTALLISAKYSDEKLKVPTIHELIAMCCDIYDVSMFIQMEWHILDTLEWVIGHPTAESFSQQLMEEEGEDQEVGHMAAFLREIALYHRDFISTKPSILARISFVLAQRILGRADVSIGEWDQDTYLQLSGHLHNPSRTLAIKYASSDFSRASQKLAKFVAEQAVITYRASNPTIPPIKHIIK